MDAAGLCSRCYLNRDFNTLEVRWFYWTRRFWRFYPDFFLSTFLLKLPYFFGCHDYSWLSWLSNGLSLFLFTAWYRFIPGSNNINGPVWFIVMLFWLWVFFPFLLKPVKTVFGGCNWGDFLAKLGLLWVISLLPWYSRRGSPHQRRPQNLLRGCRAPRATKD